MDENFEVVEVVKGKEKHFSDKKFLNKLKEYGLKLGFKTIHAATTLYVALKSDKIPTQTKLMIVGVLGYFILPTDILPDFIPGIGLADDAVIILKTISSIYSSITDEMREEAHHMLKEVFGEKYQDLLDNEDVNKNE